ncbi:rod shape-determining protein [Clostridium sp. MSJ-11]|uniref:Rod shape-determining protein n=1 Tax=Clostridium mobile TaxID=2841512 RepID=A0ABS6EI34_9CLOT|nr:cell division FtsA domain-containing protein [Clostridium mobile]MBU5484877.1 rod shape-determining protein [Clostridium mobile]
MMSANIDPKDMIFALDIGTKSVIGVLGVVKDKKLYIHDEIYVEHEERAMIDGQIHDISLVANAVNKVKKGLEEKSNIKLTRVAIAAAGRFLKTITVKSEISLDENREIDKDIIRSLELTAVKKAEDLLGEDENGKLYCVGYSIVNYYLNGYVIGNLLSQKGNNIGVEVIATFLPKSVIDSLYSVMDKVSLEIISLTLEPIAAIEAAIPKNLRLLNLALVDIGAGTSDIAISSKDTVVAYGMVSVAGDEVTEVIAQNCLVPFNGAEGIKKAASQEEVIKYTDILGMENEISAEEIKKIIGPMVIKIGDEIGEKILELNGGKSPNAVFLVGGGAHTPGIKEALSQKLNIPLQRIGIKGREGVDNCVCDDNSLGSVGVTVLGIALVAIKELGYDFINVILNGNVISLFNSHKHTVMDVLLQAGINPKMLIGKNGKNIRFMLNEIKRVAFGTLASNAEVWINGKKETIDCEVREGQNIQINFAKDGEDASPKVMEYINQLYSTTFYLNDMVHTLEPICIINGNQVSIEEEIKDGDEVEIINLLTLGDFSNYFEMAGYEYYLNEEILKDNYVIKEGDRIYRRKIENNKEEAITKEETKEEELAKEEELIKKEESINSEAFNEIEVIVNGKKILLKGKEKYVFVDIFDYIDMDLTKLQGNLILKLNGENAQYHTILNPGDNIEARWES